MKQRRPDLPDYMPGGINNPLGARALYIGSTLYRIHGTNEPWTIGTDVSSGCIRMVNDDVIDLYEPRENWRQGDCSLVRIFRHHTDFPGPFLPLCAAFAELLKRFHRDERGNFAIMFGLLAVVLIATSGAVVDFTSVQQARTRSQTALDSASLALQPRITLDTNDVLKTKAQAILTERLADTSLTATVTSAEKNTTEGSITLNATISKNTAFVSLIGIPSISAKLVSQATRKQLDLEVAMVLDNSISMNQSSRMTNLKLAANCAVGVLLNGDCNSTATTSGTANVKIGISPFTEFVNVGTANKTATWMTQDGATPTSKMNFDNDDNDGNTFSTNVNRFALYTSMGVTWSGCVEARNHTTGADGSTTIRPTRCRIRRSRTACSCRSLRRTSRTPAAISTTT